MTEPIKVINLYEFDEGYLMSIVKVDCSVQQTKINVINAFTLNNVSRLLETLSSASNYEFIILNVYTAVKENIE